MQRGKWSWRRLLSGFLATAPFAVPGPPAAREEVLHLFDYDAGAPLDVRVEATMREPETGLTLHTLSYASPKGGRVPATLIVPDGPGPFAGILSQHGLPGRRQEQVPEAEELARRGAVVLMIDAPFSRPDRPYIGDPGDPVHFTAGDREDQIQLIVGLRRGVDLLLARPDVDGARLGYLGVSYGGAMGGLLAGVERRLRAFALVVGDGGLISHFTADGGGSLRRLPAAQAERWLAAMGPIEPLHWVGRAVPAELLFQNGRRDRLVPPASARAYQAAGSEPKTILWYDADHALGPRARRDRHDWLARRLGLRAAPPL